MPSRFTDKLKAIRDACVTRSAEDAQVRKQAEAARSERTSRGIEFRERLETVIDEFTKSWQTEAPSFELKRGFFEGKYMLALRAGDEPDDGALSTDRAYSRLMFLLSPDLEEDLLQLQCRKTIRDRDLDSASVTQPMTEVGLVALTNFVEAQFVEFAERYFAAKGNPTSVGT